MYGFKRFSRGLDRGAYYHPCFVRGEEQLVKGMIRRKIKGTKVRRSLNRIDEPDFYSSRNVFTSAMDSSKTAVAGVSPSSAQYLHQASHTNSFRDRQQPILPCLHVDTKTAVSSLMQQSLASVWQNSRDPSFDAHQRQLQILSHMIIGNENEIPPATKHCAIVSEIEPIAFTSEIVDPCDDVDSCLFQFLKNLAPEGNNYSVY
jgi:hypothetical protein